MTVTINKPDYTIIRGATGARNEYADVSTPADAVRTSHTEQSPPLVQPPDKPKLWRLPTFELPKLAPILPEWTSPLEGV